MIVRKDLSAKDVLAINSNLNKSIHWWKSVKRFKIFGILNIQDDFINVIWPDWIQLLYQIILLLDKFFLFWFQITYSKVKISLSIQELINKISSLDSLILWMTLLKQLFCYVAIVRYFILWENVLEHERREKLIMYPMIQKLHQLFKCEILLKLGKHVIKLSFPIYLDLMCRLYQPLMVYTTLLGLMLRTVCKFIHAIYSLNYLINSNQINKY